MIFELLEELRAIGVELMPQGENLAIVLHPEFLRN
jgi:hypothetical protein